MVQIRLIEYPKFRMLEFKKRDFKFSIGISKEGSILLNSNDFFEYEIYGNITNNRLKNILEFFIKFFSGTVIKFYISDIVCDLEFVNHIEELKFSNILELLSKYENLVKVHKLNKNKNIVSSKNSFYELFLLNEEINKKSIETWINLNIDNIFKVKVGDKIILKRLYSYKFKNFPFDLLEVIEVKNPLTEKELINNKIQLNRRTVKISLSRVYNV